MTDERVAGSPAEAEVVATFAVAAAKPSDYDPDIPQGLILPPGSALVFPDMRPWRAHPSRKTGVHLPATVGSFVDIVNRHRTSETTVWVHPTSGRVEAVLDDHEAVGQIDLEGAGAPGWGEHRVVLELSHTPEWDYWIGADGEKMSQEEFAEHIEGGLEEIGAPDGSDLLELVSNFHATNNSTFRQSIRLQSGEQQINYEENVQAHGPAGSVTIPKGITLVVAPFVGEGPVTLFAKFRFRVVQGRLSLSYHIERPEKAIRDALDKVAETLEGEFGGIVHLGVPRDPTEKRA